MYQVQSPILFLIFNRPKETQVLFNAIKAVKPKRLYVAADGPRRNGKDEMLCKDTKNILKQIDWECELITLFREENLGCGIAVSTAITWFFEKENEGIILEDDCEPSLDFFRFCDEMLEKYRVDERISHICGTNFQDGIKRGEGDYYYSKTSPIWGWASWRRTWKTYDFEMKDLNYGFENDLLSTLTDVERYKKRMYKSLFKVQKGIINTWDYQFFFSNVLHNRMSVISNYNLISNIGFNEDATHTVDVGNSSANITFQKLPLIIISPKEVTQNKDADAYSLKKELFQPFSINATVIWLSKKIGMYNTLRFVKIELKKIF